MTAVLCDRHIIEYCLNGMITPFDRRYVNPASLDLTLSGDIIEITSGGVVDASNPRSLTTERKIRLEYGQSYLLQPGTFILASSKEYINLPPAIAAEVKLKSSTARKGIGHVYSGWIDPGFQGNITFELFSHVPVMLQAGIAICQIVFLTMDGIPDKPYEGRYQYQVGPTPAREQQLTFEFPGLKDAITSGYIDARGEPLELPDYGERDFPKLAEYKYSDNCDKEALEVQPERKRAFIRGDVDLDARGNVIRTYPPEELPDN